MGYRLERGESVTDGIRRVAREQIDEAIDEVDDGDLVRHEAVHQVRKRCKKLRGLVRLVRPGFEETYDRENAWYRDTARGLSDVRDAHSIIETLDDLVGYFSEQIDPDAFAPIRASLVAHRREVAGDMAGLDAMLAEARDRLVEGRQRIEGWQVEEDGFAMVGAGLKKTFRRGRRTMDVAYDKCTVEAFHEWRKRVKYHWYHLRLLSNTWPAVIAARAEQAKLLSDYLGDSHDLAVLCDTVEGWEEDVSRSTVEALLGLADRRREALRTMARPLGLRFYHEKPGAVVRRHAGLWDAWTSEEGA